MRNKLFQSLGFVAVAGILLASCTKNLDRKPFYDVTSATVYKDLTGYKQVLAKTYAGLSLTGNSGPDGNGDISGIDEGFSSYLRQYWQAQELPTDEAVIGWNDATIRDFHNMNWSSSDVFLRALYNRIYFQITLCNEFIRESTPAKLGERNIGGSDATEIGYFRAEARYLRALSYYHALDLYGNVPFVTESDPIGTFLPPMISRANLFTFIETELLAIESQLKAAKTNEYGRVDAASAWALLAKLYLNAAVYTTTPKYTEAITYSNKVIAVSGYSLVPNYRYLFLADNNVTSTSENVFPVTFDGTRSRTWGGTTYLVHAPIVGSMSASTHGVDFGWGGLRTTKQFVQKFADPSGLTDKRASFYTSGQNIEIADVSTATDGYGIIKFRNVTSTGANGSNITWVDTDYPMFRLAEIYLTYAEAVLRGGSGGSNATAINYINLLRQRAYGNTSGNVSSIDLQFILDERARELYWEATRRTDLIRYGQFTENTYLWAWKGGVAGGQAVSSNRKLYPIPAADLTANPNLIQNPGY
jgi:hypothetical protein